VDRGATAGGDGVENAEGSRQIAACFRWQIHPLL
jgi:hypothetical protein